MKTKLNTILIIFSILPLIVITTITLFVYGKKIESDRYKDLLSSVRSGSEIISCILRTQESELSFLARQNEIVSICTTTETQNRYENIYQELQKDLLQKLHLNPNYEMLTIYDHKGDVLATTSSLENYQNVSSSLLIQTITKTKETAIGSVQKGTYQTIPADNTLFEIGAPIFQQQSNHIVGYLVLTVDVAFLEDYLSGLELGDSNYSCIIDQTGETLLSHGDGQAFQKKGEDFSSFFLHAIRVKPTKGTFHMGSSYSGAIYSYYYLENMQCYFVIGQNVNLFHTVYSYAITIVLICIIILLITILISSRKIAQSFTSPLLNLRDCMRQAADGNLTVLCNVKSKDEFGELSRSFNKMLHIIKSNYDELSFIHKKLLVKEEQLRSNYEHIEFLAYHDSLTRLPNKAAFYDYLSKTLNSEPGCSQAHAIFFVDLDNFKNVNDTLGHDYGDELLIQTAKRLNYFIKGQDVLARAGGDEFLFFKTNIASQDDALDLAKMILETFKDPVNINGTFIYISMSIGISLYPLNGIQYNTLIKNADIAMYRSKDTGKNRLTLFDDSMQQEISRHSEIIEILRHAIENNEIYLVYQPQFDLNLERIIGFEALMRIRSAKLGELSPTEFIPIAEESGMINDLGQWALREACNFNRHLQNSGFPYCTVAVNISTIQLNQKGFANLVLDTIKETGLSPEYLELEITESAIASSIRDAVSILEELQRIGIRISLDDFGTGYSSLNYLTQMPINTLKIDKAFIDKINLNKKDNYVAEAIISLAHNLEVKVVAEGVEDPNQLNLLREKQCDLIQGYLYSKPLHPEELIHILS
ncbi:bifunctional diguanylate cyclase/phosphodiesterase [Anaerosporobacter faecicola]|uniref:bifunctional diguanylate cyclase/phosphodiesterase n=1 Tax=Anaerosporobacter faecicola TaxID=2718714 RepID=UPI00143A7ACC|nr:EAL domain-containing protein [Anaerosporobacter faecicola]